MVQEMANGVYSDFRVRDGIVQREGLRNDIIQDRTSGAGIHLNCLDGNSQVHKVFASWIRRKFFGFPRSRKYFTYSYIRQ